MIGHIAKPLVALAKRLLGPLLIGYVDRHPANHRLRAIDARNWELVHERGVQRAVGMFQYLHRADTSFVLERKFIVRAKMRCRFRGEDLVIRLAIQPTYGGLKRLLGG